MRRAQQPSTGRTSVGHEEMSKRQVDRIREVTALAARAGTEGERQAAEAALDWLAAKRQRKRPRQQQRLTDALIKRLPVPARGNRITYDSDVPGFGARVTDWRRKVLYSQLRDQERPGAQAHDWFSAADWRATAARAEAKRIAVGHRPGRRSLEPILRPSAQAPTMAELCDFFAAEHLPRTACEQSQADYKRMTPQPSDRGAAQAH